MFCQKTLHETWCVSGCVVTMKLPITSYSAVFWIMQIVSTEEFSSLMQNLMQICCSTHSVTLNVTATQSICSQRRHSLTSTVKYHCSHIHIPVHSSWLPGHIDVAETTLVTLTKAGVFLDRPHIFYIFKFTLCMWVYTETERERVYPSQDHCLIYS